MDNVGVKRINKLHCLLNGASFKCREQTLADHVEILGLERVSIHNSEAVDERGRQALTSTALVMRVLSREEAELWMSCKGLTDFWNEHFTSVVETSVETFQN